MVRQRRVFQSRVESEFRLASRYKHAGMTGSLNFTNSANISAPADRSARFLSSSFPPEYQGQPLQVLCLGPFVMVFELE
jgi:hypothetical protein